MKRVLEPELMNEYEQVKAYSKGDFSLSDGNMCMRLEKFISSIGYKVCEESLIVDIGCGPGNITERLCRCWPFTKVVGIDGSAEMLKVARKRKEKLKTDGFLNTPLYIQENLASFSSGKASLEKSAEILVSNSLLHHIHDPSQFWAAISNLGKKGSITFHRDLRRPSSYEEAIFIKQKYQQKGLPLLNNDFLASLLASFSLEEVEIQYSES